MYRILCKSKIHNATITKTNLHYEGSIGIDEQILKKVDIIEGEKVQVLNLNSGARFETYTIKEKPNSGTICLYGPAAHLGHPGDKIIIIAYGIFDEASSRTFKKKIAYLDKKNKIVIK